MKKKYLQPTTDLLSLVTEASFICASGEDLLSREYGSKEGEETVGFWD